jgi:hypothetical protein
MWFWDPVCYLHPHLERVDKIFPWQRIRRRWRGCPRLFPPSRLFFEAFVHPKIAETGVGAKRGVPWIDSVPTATLFSDLFISI